MVTSLSAQGDMMKRMHVVLVCHTELDFEGSWCLYEKIQPTMEDLFKRISDVSGKAVRTTFCVTADFLSERLDEAFRLIESGHEIGIHSHLPGAHRPCHRYDGHYAFRMDEEGVVNQDKVSGPLRDLAIALGLPDPRTRVGSMFSFHQTTIRTLQQAGFHIDCSMIPGIERATHPACGDFVLCDNRRRELPYPYRPDANDPWADGDSAVLEFPVSGNLGGGDIDGQIRHLRERLEGDHAARPYRGYWYHFGQTGEDVPMSPAAKIGVPRDVDVFQTFWHHFEFAELGWTRGRLDDAEKFLMEGARHNSITFSTASEAALDLEQSGL